MLIGGMTGPQCGQSRGSGGELTASNCMQGSARYAALQGPAANTVARAGGDLACMVRLGDAGCLPPQPLEAALKALWPSAAGDPRTGALAFTDGSRGTPLNAGFLRADSLIVVIVASDVDDCSTGSAELQGLDPVGMLHRCSVAPELRADLMRYEQGLRQLRGVADDLVMFFALAGVPASDQMLLSETALEREDQRERYYDTLLENPAFAPDSLDTRGTPDPGDDIPPTICTTSTGPVYGAPRLLSLARSFGTNGLALSLCHGDLRFAMNAILRSIGRRLGPPPI
jgi:hypothetical protein